ncbi:hypothetical protein [Plantibacter sp. YIM 135347]|uniref:hypothetical protein n=1 Tax=Plantibacter sp. YIM 135347 TaxID=3423919 RepID=UPI003D336E5E
MTNGETTGPTDPTAQPSPRTAAAAGAPGGARPSPSRRPAPPKRSRWWTVTGITALVLGGLLAPIAVVAVWADTMIEDTDVFVSTFAPLADDRAVQDLVTDQVVDLVEQQVNLDGITGSVSDVAASLGLPAGAADVLKLLGGSAADGLGELLHRNVAEFVASQPFRTVWTESLRATHREIVTGAAGRDGAAASVGTDGELGIELQPVVAGVRSWLVDAGFAFARLIPDTDHVIVLVSAEDAAPALAAIHAIDVGAAWTPWLAAALLLGGVLLLWRGRRNLPWALAVGGVAVAVGSVVVVGAVYLGRTMLLGDVGSSTTADGVAAIVDQAMQEPLVGLWTAAGISAIVAVGGFVASRFTVARR